MEHPDQYSVCIGWYVNESVQFSQDVVAPPTPPGVLGYDNGMNSALCSWYLELALELLEYSIFCCSAGEHLVLM